TLHYRADAAGICSNTASSGTFSQRPNLRFSQAANVNYSWAPATFLSSTNIANPIAQNVTAATTYTVSAEYSGCTTNETVSVNIDPLTLSVNASPNDTVCEGTNLTLTSSASGGGAPYAYAWAGPNGFTSNDQNPVLNAITVAEQGTYTLTITDNCSTVLTDQIIVTVNPSSVTITPSSATYCIPGNAVELIASGADTYTWSPAAGLSSTSGSSVQASPSATTSYIVSGLALNGCVSTDTVVVSVYNSPSIASIVATPSLICPGDSAQIVATLPATSNYCAPTVTSSGASGDYITNFSFADITNNGTADAVNDYTYYSALTANVVANGTTQYALSITPGGTIWGQQFRVWIDFNQNGVFEASESVFNTSATVTGPNSATANITIPTTALNGVTRMRVADKYSSTPTLTESCTMSGFGEFEDYNISITGGVNNSMQYAWTPSGSLTDETVSNPIAFPTMSETYTLIITDGNGCTATNNVSINVNPAVTVNLGSDVIQCGGTVLLDAGNPGMDFEWNDMTTAQTLTASASGIYIVKVTDPNTGCNDTSSVEVTINTIPVVDLGSDTIQCGGTVLLDAGNAGFDFEWNDMSTLQTLNTATSGIYTVTVTDPNTGCFDSDNVEVTINPLPVVNLGSDITQCGGTVLLDAGNTGLGFEWNDMTTAQTLTASTSGVYFVTVTEPNTGCINSDTIEVTINAVPFVNLGSDITQCGGTVLLDAGNPGMDYEWSNMSTGQTITVSSTNTYSVTVTDPQTGCNDNGSILVTINAIPSVNFAPFTSIMCVDDAAVTLSGGSPLGGIYSGTGVSGGMFDPGTAGADTHTITYTVTGANLCTNSATEDQTVDLCTGIKENGSPEFVIYPNPTLGIFNISVNDANFDQLLITIIDLNGREVYNEIDKNIFSNYTKQINLNGLSRGIYYIKLNIGTELKVHKIILQ
ncbi:MAG: GEVED domain-containing protein, partial [Bacteroidota bacterium]|nr:GEVED domain-containing protein [Bacteroidota bacterium]